MSRSLNFPPVVSSEYETRPTFWVNDGDGYQKTLVEPVDLVNAMAESPDALGQFGVVAMKNGGIVYSDSKGPEFGHPECASPSELVKHSIAMDEGYKEFLARYALLLAAGHSDTGVMARLHRRVVDSDLNTWACHDNISISKDLATILGTTPRNQQSDINPHAALLLRHLMWRSFISGAGLVTPNGLRFAQKVDSVKSFNEYGFLSSYFRVDSMHGARLETRCSDRNLNNTAAVLRVGGAATMAAILQTPLVHRVHTGDRVIRPEQGSDFNTLDLMLDGTIKPSRPLIQAVDGEQRILDAAQYLPNYMDVPKEYKGMVDEWRKYCDDFTKVMAGEATIDLIADRADWARKMQLVLEYVAEDPRKRKLTDIGARGVDMAYDATTILARGGKVGAKDGQGVKDQRNADMPYTPDAEAVELARTTPPDTRAADRVRQTLGTVEG